MAKSKGTLNNIQNLVSLGKKALVYFGPAKAFHKVSSDDDLQRLLDLSSECDVDGSLEPEPANPMYILTEPGLGYRFHFVRDETSLINRGRTGTQSLHCLNLPCRAQSSD
jgi:hypothetical protein